MIGGTPTVLNALDSIADDPQGVGAINFSVVLRQGFCQRQATTEFTLCTRKVGQDTVNRLEALGIPLVVGLHNIDIGNDEETWPACLDNVVKVGAANDNIDLQNGGIGIGGMDVDFYAKSSVSANNPDGGNSLASPRIATALAILREFDPTSTVKQRIAALKASTARTNNYRFNNVDYRRPSIRSSDIPNAIVELQKLTRGNIDNIFFDDPGEYGPTFEDDSTEYAFTIDFDNLIGSDVGASNQASKTTSVSTVRDVVLTFDTKMSNSFNGLQVFINGSLRETTDLHVDERSFSYTLNRTFFNSGENTVVIKPSFTARPWGLSNIKADFTPVVALELNQVGRNHYGSEEDPERPTGLRASFILDTVESDLLFSVTGREITSADEVRIFLNGIDYGFLKQLENSSDRFSPQDTFVFSQSDLVEGGNIIEFIQKDGGAQWGVTNMLITSDSLSPQLAVGITNTVEYGNNYGTNEHPLNLDVTFIAENEHDHNISWQAFDIDQNLLGTQSDVDLYLNDQFIKRLNPTNSNQLGAAESITLASRLFISGTNTFSFRLRGDAQDTTWGVTNLLVRTSPVLDLDSESTLEKDFGYFTQHRGSVPFGWTRTYSTQDYQTRLYATFDSSATQDKIIEVTGWDIDAPVELGVYVNGVFLQYITSAEASSVYSIPDLIRIPKERLIAGTNTISFRTDTRSGFNDEKWGIFFGAGQNISIRNAGFLPAIMLLLDDE